MNLKMRRLYMKPMMQLWNTQSTGMLALSGSGDANIGYGGNASENGGKPLDARGFAWDDGDADDAGL